MSVSHGFKGLWVPRGLWLATDLSIVEKCLVAEVWALSDGPSGCTARNDFFQEFFALGASRIKELLARAIATGWLASELKNGHDRILRAGPRLQAALLDEANILPPVYRPAPATLPAGEKSEGGPENRPGGGRKTGLVYKEENIKENIISNTQKKSDEPSRPPVVASTRPDTPPAAPPEPLLQNARAMLATPPAAPLQNILIPGMQAAPVPPAKKRGRPRLGEPMALESEAEEIWAEYPKKEDKKEGVRAIRLALDKLRAQGRGNAVAFLKSRVKAYAEHRRLTMRSPAEQAYTKYAQGWFSAERWNDEYAHEIAGRSGNPAPLGGPGNFGRPVNVRILGEG